MNLRTLIELIFRKRCKYSYLAEIKINGTQSILFSYFPAFGFMTLFPLLLYQLSNLRTVLLACEHYANIWIIKHHPTTKSTVFSTNKHPHAINQSIFYFLHTMDTEFFSQYFLCNITFFVSLPRDRYFLRLMSSRAKKTIVATTVQTCNQRFWIPPGSNCGS